MAELSDSRKRLNRLLWNFFPVAQCKPLIIDYSVKPADTRSLKRVFSKYATVKIGTQLYMTPENMIRDYLGMQSDDRYNESTLKLLAGVVDQTKDGLISFSEFLAFETLLCDPDAHHKLIFQMFDLDGKGSVSFDEFKRVIEQTSFFGRIPFNFKTEFINAFFAKDRSRQVPYEEFSQFLQDLEKEYQRQAFFQCKMVDDYSIKATDFSKIMKELRGHILSPYVREYILTVAGGEAKHIVSYGYYRAFNDLLDNINTFHDLLLKVAKGNRFREISKEEFMQETHKTHPKITPLHVDILFHLCDVEHKRGRITVSDVHQCIPKHDVFKIFSSERQIEEFIEEPKEEEVSVLWRFAEQAYRFSLGSIAGACGATAVYPIDLVKTRMQNQRAVLANERLYANSFDCFIKVIKNEGPRGLYRGLIPQLVGVSPEKAIKLTTNDFVRDLFSDKDRYISPPYEMVAGGCGGAAQVLFTNPLEIVKIRLQVAGESGNTKVTALGCVKELGITGLYKGARACFLRDIPFSAIYFTAYAHLKLHFADENGHNGPGTLFLSALMAGAPAAFFVTPADVIKTRLQVKARQGQQTYRGVTDCARKVWKEEGGRAFWKGSGARVFRSSPQFGVTLLTYELLQRFFDVDFGGNKKEKHSDLLPTNRDLSLHPDHIGGMRLAVATFAGVETKFGICLPKFRSPVAEAKTE